MAAREWSEDAECSKWQLKPAYPVPGVLEACCVRNCLSKWPLEPAPGDAVVLEMAARACLGAIKCRNGRSSVVWRCRRLEMAARACPHEAAREPRVLEAYLGCEGPSKLAFEIGVRNGRSKNAVIEIRATGTWARRGRGKTVAQIESRLNGI
jgi:hypothetical protein